MTRPYGGGITHTNCKIKIRSLLFRLSPIALDTPVRSCSTSVRHSSTIVRLKKTTPFVFCRCAACLCRHHWSSLSPPRRKPKSQICNRCRCLKDNISSLARNQQSPL